MTTNRNPGGMRKLVGPPLVTIERDDLLDPRLSLTARGLMATMHADPDYNLPETAEVAAAFAELEAAGYIGEPDVSAEPAEDRPRVVPPSRSTSVVYYLRRWDGAVKIGFTAHLTSRIKTLAGEHGDLDLLAREPGGWHLEQSRHAEFADLRISPTLEWFRPGEPLMAHIDGLQSAVVV